VLPVADMYAPDPRITFLPRDEESPGAAANRPRAQGHVCPRELVAMSKAGGETVSVKRIWDEGEHNAFCGFVRHEGRWWCTFREATGHVSEDGALRVIVSDDGERWRSTALIALEGSDLRDPKLEVTPDGTLMLLAGDNRLAEGEFNRSMTWFSADGEAWHGPFIVADDGLWLWRVTWHRGVAWGVGYGVQGGLLARLYRSRCGMRFERIEPDIYTEDYPNETRILFLEDDTALCLLRMDGEGATGKLGRAAPPYTDWRWRDLGVKIGGPEMLRLPDGRFVACVRLYDEPVRTSLMWLDVEQATLTEFLTLPSGGDTSYAGMVWHEGLLWVAYYSSHEEKTCIYLAKVQLD